jgi:exopolysaccharide biosynthesis polyprenyl glycosylphosphotransferase
MTDVTMDVGAIRPVVAVRPPDDQLLETLAPPPDLRSNVDGPLAATTAPAATTVTTVVTRLGTELTPASPRALDDAARAVSGLLRRRQADVWLLLECLVAVCVGLATVVLVGAFAPAAWVAILGAGAVAVRTQPQLRATGHIEIVPVLRSLAVVFAAAAALSVTGLASTAELATSGWTLLAMGTVIVAALCLRRCLARPARVVVVGDRAAIGRAAMRWSDGSVHVVGGVLAGPEESRLQTIVGVPTIAGIEQVADWARGRRADLVIVVPGEDVTGHQVRHLAWSLERTEIGMAVSDLAGDAAPHRVQARRLGRTTVVELAPTRRGPLARTVKGVIDRVMGLVLLILAAPFLGLLMLSVRLDSRGSALFRQVRVGRGGRSFVMYKLRTMHPAAEEQLATLREKNDGDGPLFKVFDDPRITRFGRLLRRTSMDELPQLINVVMGQMSLVGPRPALPCEVAEYDEVERRRLAVKPGMTGLWQVSGRSHLSWETSVELDLEYVDNWRVSQDLLIGCRTLGAVVKGRGAY